MHSWVVRFGKDLQGNWQAKHTPLNSNTFLTNSKAKVFPRKHELVHEGMHSWSPEMPGSPLSWWITKLTPVLWFIFRSLNEFAAQIHSASCWRWTATLLLPLGPKTGYCRTKVICPRPPWLPASATLTFDCCLIPSRTFLGCELTTCLVKTEGVVSRKRNQ